MWHTVDFDPVNQLALTTFRGPLLIDDAATLLREVIAHPEWTPQWSRIINYDDAMLGELNPEAVQGAQRQLGEIIKNAYKGAPTFSAQVCFDPLKRPLLEYWIGLNETGYPAEMKLFATVSEARSWILAARAGA
tara:strand:- start:10204 stop:10605 length:402 start_codon:yes stop_codon:yes gene_type:complete